MSGHEAVRAAGKTGKESPAPEWREAQVRVEDPGSLNLVGLIIREMINQNMLKPGVARMIARMNVVMEIRASRMIVTLRVQNGLVSLENGSAPDAQVRVRGSMNDFLALGLFKIPWGGLLRGRLWASGRIDKLPKILRLLVA